MAYGCACDIAGALCNDDELFIPKNTPATAITEIIINSNEHHEHGACNPVAAISGKGVDAVVCAGIGAGAMHKLNAAGIKVYCGDYKFAEDCVNAVIKKEAVEMTADKACGGHSCGHH